MIIKQIVPISENHQKPLFFRCFCKVRCLLVSISTVIFLYILNEGCRLRFLMALGSIFVPFWRPRGFLKLVFSGLGTIAEFQWNSGPPKGPPKSWVGQGLGAITRILGPSNSLTAITCNCWTDDSRPQLLNSWLQLQLSNPAAVCPWQAGAGGLKQTHNHNNNIRRTNTIEE